MGEEEEEEGGGPRSGLVGVGWGRSVGGVGRSVGSRSVGGSVSLGGSVGSGSVSEPLQGSKNPIFGHKMPKIQKTPKILKIPKKKSRAPKPLQGSKIHFLATLGQDGAWIRAPWNQPCPKMGSRGPETSKKGVFRPPRGFGTEFKMQISSSTEFEAERNRVQTDLADFEFGRVRSNAEFEATPSSSQLSSLRSPAPN